jgi:hypothetical protein
MRMECVVGGIHAHRGTMTRVKVNVTAFMIERQDPMVLYVYLIDQINRIVLGVEPGQARVDDVIIGCYQSGL